MTLPTWIGPYRVSHLLGRGNQGQVCLAICAVTGERVAIKVSHGKLTGVAWERVLREFRLSARLDDPSVPQPRRLGQLDDGRTFVVSRFVDGTHLWKWRRSLEPKGSAQRTRRIGRRLHQLAQILERVHAKGVVHGDLKLSAAMLDHTSPKMWLLDFGGAVEEAHATAGRYFGTARYSAPEQLAKHALTTAADIWSFGVVGTLLSSGRWPLKGSRAEVHKQLTVDPGAVARGLDAVDPLLKPILAPCLSAAPSKRPPAAWLVAQLATWASPWPAGRPQPSPPPLPSPAQLSEPPKRSHDGEVAAAWARARAVLLDDRAGAIIALTVPSGASPTVQASLHRTAERVYQDAQELGRSARLECLAPAETTERIAGQGHGGSRREEIAPMNPAARWRGLRKWLSRRPAANPAVAIVYGTDAELARWVIKDHQLHHIEVLRRSEGPATMGSHPMTVQRPNPNGVGPKLSAADVQAFIAQGRLDELEIALLARVPQNVGAPQQVRTWWRELAAARRRFYPFTETPTCQPRTEKPS